MDFDLGSIERVAMLPGTASYVGMVGKYWIERFAGVPVEVDVASEYRYREPILLPNTLGLVISQSGETADTLAALRHLKSRGVTTAGIINVPTSTMAREVDLLLPTHPARRSASPRPRPSPVSSPSWPPSPPGSRATRAG
jgi:glucosamine--fructose-6-phosphate aminotransferase (isomerizing)